MKNKSAILLVLILAFSAVVNFQLTEAQEQKSASETWSVVRWVNETYTVNEGETLTIMPGTTIYLADNASIVVSGTLKAEGTEDNMILFTCWNTSGYWDEIKFESSSTNCIIKYCEIEYGLVSCYSSAPQISHIVIGYSHGHGIYCNNADLDISYSTIFSPDDCGIFVYGGTLTATHNHIYDISATGIFCSGSSGNITFNDISGPGWGIIADARYNPCSPTICGNRIHDCNWGIGIRYQDAKPTVSHNDISNNSKGVGCYFRPAPKINYNNIYGNTDYGIYVELDIPTLLYSVDATNNYWGASDGPSGEGSGSGDKVSKNVEYTPFLSERTGVEPPVASFTYSLTTAVQTVQFTDCSSDDTRIVVWHWDFGDGNTSSEQSPIHQYLRGNKTYNVTLTVTDSDNYVSNCTKQVDVPLVDSDLDNDSIPDSLDADRDGDGVLNNVDAYPDDPLKYKKEAVTAEKPLNLVPIVVAIIIAVLILVVIAITVSLRKKRK